MSFAPRKATEINRRLRTGPGGSTIYIELARAVAELDMGYSISVSPADIGKDNDMSDLSKGGSAEKFRSGVATAMKRHVVEKYGIRLRTTIDADGCVQVERVKDAAQADAPAAVVAEDNDDDDEEEEF